MCTVTWIAVLTALSGCSMYGVNASPIIQALEEIRMNGSTHNIQREVAITLLDGAVEDLLQNISNTLSTLAVQQFRPMDCQEIFRTDNTATGVYTIYPGGSAMVFPVRCDMETDGGGWTVIQRRADGSTNFNQHWYAYQTGFGSIENEFWLGNEQIHAITSQARYELRIDMIGPAADRKHATYDWFRVGGGQDSYRLFVGGFSTPSDLKDKFILRGGHPKCSTPDSDKDTNEKGNCAAVYSSGWWFKGCHSALLNGVYGANYTGGLMWDTWTNDLRFVEMKVRKFQG